LAAAAGLDFDFWVGKLRNKPKEFHVDLYAKQIRIRSMPIRGAKVSAGIERGSLAPAFDPLASSSAA
jgi:hypothetical protein